MSRRPDLLIEGGALSGRRFAVPDGGLRLGRSSSCDIHIPDEGLSRNQCIFECDGEAGIRVIDLCSANGTFVNGEQIGLDAKPLAVGDVIEVGETTIRVVSDEPVATPAPAGAAAVAPGAAVDLGLGAAREGAAAETGAAAPRRKAAVNLVVAAIALVLVAASAVILLLPVGGASRKRADASDVKPRPAAEFVSLVYEKVDADATHIFRYSVAIDAKGKVKADFEDVPGENRLKEASGELNEQGMGELQRIFDGDEWRALKSAKSSDETGGNSLKLRRIRLVRGGEVKEVRIENAGEGEAFTSIRVALETLVNNALGMQAVQRSREELAKSAADNEELGDKMWEERDAKYGNLFASVRFYKLALGDLDSLGASAGDASRLQERVARSKAELDRRYKDVRYEAMRSAKVRDWDNALVEYRKIREMIPDRGDPRHQEANANIIEIERRLEAEKKAKKGGSGK